MQHPILPHTTNSSFHSPLQETHVSTSHVSDTTSHMAHDSSPSDIPHIQDHNSMSNHPQSSNTTTTPSLESLQTNHTKWHVSISDTRSPSFHTQTSLPQTPLTINNHAMLTRSKTGRSKPKVFVVHTEPSSTKQALTNP